MSDYQTFEQWADNAEPENVFHFGYLNRHERAVYYMFDHPVFIETYYPSNFLKPIQCVVKATGFNMPKDHEIMALAEKHGAEWEEGYYAEEGYGWPVWKSDEDDRAEECFNFLKEYKTNKNKYVA